MTPEETRQFFNSHPCRQCHEPARRVMSAANFSFVAPVGRPTAGSGVHGQSGSHDLDYPSLDKAVGRSSEKRWAGIMAREAAKEVVRKATGRTAKSDAQAVLKAQRKVLADATSGLTLEKTVPGLTIDKK